MWLAGRQTVQQKDSWKCFHAHFEASVMLLTWSQIQLPVINMQFSVNHYIKQACYWTLQFEWLACLLHIWMAQGSNPESAILNGDGQICGCPQSLQENAGAVPQILPWQLPHLIQICFHCFQIFDHCILITNTIWHMVWRFKYTASHSVLSTAYTAKPSVCMCPCCMDLRLKLCKKGQS